MKSIKEASFNEGTRILVRCDLDVPVSEFGNILETYRLDHLLPTLKLIIEKKGFPVIIGHLGRPGDKRTKDLQTESLKPYFYDKLGPNNFDILENLRFDPREEQNSEEYARELIDQTQTQIYVNEAFSTSHREHTSIMQLPKLMPSYVGIQFEKEVTALEGILSGAMHPFIAIVGGAKLDSKKPAVLKFLEITDGVLVGGKIGLDWDEEVSEKLFLPLDYARDNKDIGPKTREMFIKLIEPAKTIIWAGPMGMFEVPEFLVGTEVVARAIVSSSAYSVAGGGDTIAALDRLDMLDKMSFISTGGGAMLEFLIKGTLPAISVLQEKA